MAKKRLDCVVVMLSSCLVWTGNGNECPGEHSFHSVGVLHCTMKYSKYDDAAQHEEPRSLRVIRTLGIL
jgi:hypothetical protein